MKNHGFNLEAERQAQTDQDWVFGGFSLPCLASIPENDRLIYLPQGEVQRGKDDFMDCASRGPLNILETKFTWLVKNGKLSAANLKWLTDNGYIVDGKVLFSDRFVAINSGTTRQGNSLRAPLDAIRKQGLIPKSMLPKGNFTWEEYHDKSKITPEMIKLGAEFAARFTINYEKVYAVHFGDLLKEDLLDVAGYAWPEAVDGEYPKVDYDPNHCFILFKNPKYEAFDNYEEGANDFIKKLAPDYSFLGYGYRLYITSEQVPKSLWQRIVEMFSKISVSPTQIGTFDFDLKRGVIHRDVVRLQKLLNEDDETKVADSGAGSKGQESDYFGWLTFDALMRFQKKNQLPATGYFGPITRQFINSKMLTPSEQLYKTAKAHLGQNLAPGNEMLGCAISLSAIYNRTFPERTPLRFVNTGQWYDWLETNAKKVSTPEPNCIIVSTTKLAPSDSPLDHGHIGIVGRMKSDDGSLYVMSNNSLKGMWDTHWTVDSWHNYYRDNGRIPTFYYQLI